MCETLRFYRETDPETGLQWYHNPRMTCVTSELDYTDIKYQREATVRTLVNGCRVCPVLRQCRMDLLLSPVPLYGVQAGIVGIRGH